MDYVTMKEVRVLYEKEKDNPEWLTCRLAKTLIKIDEQLRYFENIARSHMHPNDVAKSIRQSISEPVNEHDNITYLTFEDWANKYHWYTDIRKNGELSSFIRYLSNYLEQRYNR